MTRLIIGGIIIGLATGLIGITLGMIVAFILTLFLPSWAWSTVSFLTIGVFYGASIFVALRLCQDYSHHLWWKREAARLSEELQQTLKP